LPNAHDGDSNIIKAFLRIKTADTSRRWPRRRRDGTYPQGEEIAMEKLAAPGKEAAKGAEEAVKKIFGK
jgi:hypothetical protein